MPTIAKHSVTRSFSQEKRWQSITIISLTVSMNDIGIKRIRESGPNCVISLIARKLQSWTLGVELGTGSKFLAISR